MLASHKLKICVGCNFSYKYDFSREVVHIISSKNCPMMVWSLYIRSHVKPILGQKVFKKMFQKCILLATKVFFSGNPPKINNPSFFPRISRWVEVSNFEYKMYIYFFAQNYLKVCMWNKKRNMKLIQTSAVSDM